MIVAYLGDGVSVGDCRYDRLQFAVFSSAHGRLPVLATDSVSGC